MNLHGIVSQYISAINPTIIATIYRSLGYSTDDSGARVPLYAEPEFVPAQIQSLQYNDMVQLDGLNIEGERRAFYVNGNWNGVARADGRGGDIILLPDGSKWLVVLVLENWQTTDGWVKLAATRQVQ